MNARVQAALKVLLEVGHYASDLDVDVRQFGVSLDDMLAAGILRVDLIWLVQKGYVEQVENTGRVRKPRRFRLGTRRQLSKNSCFILTKTGHAVAQRAAHDLDKELHLGGLREPRHRVDGSHQPSIRPHWDAASRKLFFGDVLIKRFLVPADSQEAILSEFERLAWPETIQNPLTDRPETSAQQRLHDAIKRLNGGQKPPRICFHGNGRANGVTWELVEHAVRNSDRLRTRRSR